MTIEPAKPETIAPTRSAFAEPSKYSNPEIIGTRTRYTMKPIAYPSSQNPNMSGPRLIWAVMAPSSEKFAYSATRLTFIDKEY